MSGRKHQSGGKPPTNFQAIFREEQNMQKTTQTTLGLAALGYRMTETPKAEDAK